MTHEWMQEFFEEISKFEDLVKKNPEKARFSPLMASEQIQNYQPGWESCRDKDLIGIAWSAMLHYYWRKTNNEEAKK